MMDRLRYEEENVAVRAWAAARADEIEEKLRSREAKLDETKVLLKLPGQERREQLAREKTELRRLEQDKEVGLIQKPTGKTEKTAVVDEETPVKASGSAETTTAVKEVPIKAAELAAVLAEQVVGKADEQTAKAATAATGEKVATSVTERAVSPAKEPPAEGATVAEYRPKQPKLLRTSGSLNALIGGRTPEEGL